MPTLRNFTLNRIDKFFIALITFTALWTAIQLSIQHYNLYPTPYKLFAATHRNPTYIWTYITAIYSHNSITHLAINITTLSIAWAILRQTPNQHSTRTLAASITIIPFTVCILTVATYAALGKLISFVGASMFAMPLLVYAALYTHYRHTQLDKRHALIPIAIVGIFTVEAAPLLYHWTPGEISHVYGIAAGIILTYTTTSTSDTDTDPQNQQYTQPD